MRRYPRAVDAALIVLLLCAAGGQAMLNSSVPGAEDLGWGSAVPLAVAAAVALLWRRDHPELVVVFTTACVSAEAVVGYMITPVNLAPVLLALYELTVRMSPRWYTIGVMAVTVISAVAGNRHGYPWPLVVLNPVLFPLLPVAIGTTVKARAEYAARTREEEARHRVDEERLRIAHELHDVVAHHLALANAQAGTAAYLARSNPTKVTQILEDLTTTTSSALRELKATVGQLRSPLEPLPGLSRLPELVSAFATAGLTVEVTVEGTAHPLSPNTDLTAYRIVQEALTNASKHGNTAEARVQLSYSDDHLTITVTNSAEVSAGEGFGLLGMRERAQSAGGHLKAGHTPDGFIVHTELPILT
jgi:signal transduction histidine kinase